MSTVLEQTMVVPYPGYDPKGDTLTPGRAGRAVKPEAEEYAQRSKGTLCLFTDRPQYIDTPTPNLRCPSDEGRQYLEQHRAGRVGGLINRTFTPRPDSPPRGRIRPEAEDIADGHMGKGLARLLSTTNSPPISAHSSLSVKAEGEDNFELDKGGRMKCLLTTPRQLPTTPRPEARVKPEAEANADLDRGRQMSRTIHEFGQSGGLSARGVPRVKGEAEDTAELDKGKRMANLFYSYGHMPGSARPESRVKPEAEESANMDRGGRISRLMHEGDRLPRSPRPAPRTTSAKSRQIAKASRGSMGQILAAQGSRMIVPIPGQRSKAV